MCRKCIGSNHWYPFQRVEVDFLVVLVIKMFVDFLDQLSPMSGNCSWRAIKINGYVGENAFVFSPIFELLFQTDGKPQQSLVILGTGLGAVAVITILSLIRQRRRGPDDAAAD